MKFVLRMLVSAGVIFGVAYLSGGALLRVDSFLSAFIAAVVLALVNAFVRPVVKVLTFPVTVVTLGLFALVVNAAMLYIVEWLVPGFELVGFWQTLAASIIVSIITAWATRAMEDED